VAKKDPYKIQALERAFDIIDCFRSGDSELSLSEIIEQTGLAKSTAKRLIVNLQSRNYLQIDEETKKYKLGLILLELGGIVNKSFSLRRVASHQITSLHRETGATVVLAVSIDHKLVYIDKREGNSLIRFASDIGWRRPLHFGMLGMAILAYLSTEDVRLILHNEPLKAFTPYSITDETAFLARLEEIRKQGYVFEDNEAYEGVTGIAAPIRDSSSKVIAALGLGLTSKERRDNNFPQKHIDAVLKTCETISTNLGFIKK